MLASILCRRPPSSTRTPARSAFLSRRSAFFRLAALRAGAGAAIVFGRLLCEGGVGVATAGAATRLWCDEPIACGALRVQGWGRLRGLRAFPVRKVGEAKWDCGLSHAQGEGGVRAPRGEPVDARRGVRADHRPAARILRGAASTLASAWPASVLGLAAPGGYPYGTPSSTLARRVRHAGPVRAGARRRPIPLPCMPHHVRDERQAPWAAPASASQRHERRAERGGGPPPPPRDCVAAARRRAAARRTAAASRALPAVFNAD